MPNPNPTIVIIGGGPVGLFSVFACGMLGFRCIVIDQASQLGGQCNLYPEKPIYDIPGFPEITARQLIHNLRQQIQPFHPTFIGQRLVRSIEDGLVVVDDQGDHYPADAVIIACGKGAFTPRPLECEVDLPEDIRQRIGYEVQDPTAFDGQEVVIVGAGDSAADWALALANSAKSIHMVHRRNRLTCHPHSAEQIQQHPKIHFHAPYTVQTLDQEYVHLQPAVAGTADSLRLPYQQLLAFLGLEVDLSPVDSWGVGLDMHKIPVQPTTMMTQRPGVFAIGDVAAYEGKLKLIACGFAEAFACAYGIRSYLYPGKSFHFEYSTTSGVPTLQAS